MKSSEIFLQIEKSEMRRNIMEIENKKKDFRGYLIGFIMGIVLTVVFPAILLDGVIDESYIQITAIIAVVVIPLTSVLLVMAVRLSFVNKTWVGMNLGNAFSICVLYAIASMQDMELSGHDTNVFIYGLIASLLAALFILMLDIRRQRKVVQLSLEMKAGNVK